MANKRLAIIIINWNTCELTVKCIQSIVDTASSLPYQLIIVDNASTDDSVREISRRFPDVQLIKNSDNLGFARASNQGIAASDAEYVLLLNSDTLLLPGSLTRMVDFMGSHPDAGAAGVTLLNPDLSFQASYNDFPGLLSEWVTTAGLTRLVYGFYFPSHSPEESTKSLVVDWVGGACLIMRRACLNQIGLLDEGYFMYLEELDWCYRAKQGGWRVYFIPDAKVIHLGSQSSNSSATNKSLWLQRGRIRFFSKYKPRWYLWVYIQGSRIIAILKALAWLGIGAFSQKSRGTAKVKFELNRQLASIQTAD